MQTADLIFGIDNPEEQSMGMETTDQLLNSYSLKEGTFLTTSLLKNYRWATGRGDAAPHLRPAAHRRKSIVDVVRLLLAISSVFFDDKAVSIRS